MAARTSSIIKNPWVASIVSLLVGIGLGTTFGKNVLDSAGVPQSCVRAIDRADAALATGESLADNGEAAFDAVKDVRLGEAVDLLTEARTQAEQLLDQVKAFNTAREKCREDRED